MLDVSNQTPAQHLKHGGCVARDVHMEAVA
jgi:hypothetical protein